ncbi:hypothetical protein [Lentzea sp.]|uniref:hypothetical protein n=1 Tax=Lentzea sp. TaxID=56099 RepID=UPI002CB18D3D|nr:hypothetical protein [Lentzea sp.]HUQ60392.1 hypothetical protein [Lentzea sp.]
MTRYLRTEQTMAFPHGRLIATRDGASYVLAPDGWDHLPGPRPRHATSVSREEAEDWCESEGWDLNLLDEVPTPSGR